MNIGTWPLQDEELTNSHVKYREITSKDKSQLFWTKAFLQTSSYDEQRYRQIASNACERIVLEEENEHSPSKSPYSSSSVIALSLSETSTRQPISKHHSTPQSSILPINSRKKSSSTRFSCYLKSQPVKSRSKPIKKKFSTTLLPKNNNHCQGKFENFPSNRQVIRLTDECRERMCQKCSQILRTSSTHIPSNLLCRTCSSLIQNSHHLLPIRKLPLNKSEENELRQIIEVVIEEFQDHFGQALNLSIKQMTQHLLANINLFYQHYQQEFEQLTKKYRLAFLERFLQLMNKAQSSQSKAMPTKLSISTRNSITHPPDILSMSSLSGSLATEKDRSETMAHVITPSDSISLSTASNPSIIIAEKNKSQNSRRYLPVQTSSSKKTFTLNRTDPRQSFNKSRKQIPSSLQLIDAYRFRDTLRMNNTQFSSPRPKIR